jgi:hypothetical protein
VGVHFGKTRLTQYPKRRAPLTARITVPDNLSGRAATAPRPGCCRVASAEKDQGPPMTLSYCQAVSVRQMTDAPRSARERCRKSRRRRGQSRWPGGSSRRPPRSPSRCRPSTSRPTSVVRRPGNPLSFPRRWAEFDSGAREHVVDLPDFQTVHTSAQFFDVELEGRRKQGHRRFSARWASPCRSCTQFPAGGAGVQRCGTPPPVHPSRRQTAAALL